MRIVAVVVLKHCFTNFIDCRSALSSGKSQDYKSQWENLMWCEKCQDVHSSWGTEWEGKIYLKLGVCWFIAQVQSGLEMIKHEKWLGRSWYFLGHIFCWYGRHKILPWQPTSRGTLTGDPKSLDPRDKLFNLKLGCSPPLHRFSWADTDSLGADWEYSMNSSCILFKDIWL